MYNGELSLSQRVIQTKYTDLTEYEIATKVVYTREIGQGHVSFVWHNTKLFYCFSLWEKLLCTFNAS